MIKTDRRILCRVTREMDDQKWTELDFFRLLVLVSFAEVHSARLAYSIILIQSPELVSELRERLRMLRSSAVFRVKRFTSSLSHLASSLPFTRLEIGGSLTRHLDRTQRSSPSFPKSVHFADFPLSFSQPFSVLHSRRITPCPSPLYLPNSSSH